VAKFQKLDVEKLLGDVPDENVFRCYDGSIYRNMRELRDGLETLSDETFAFHVRAERNDFGNWVRDIIGDEKLARDLIKTRNKLQSAKSVAERIRSLTAKNEVIKWQNFRNSKLKSS